MRLLLPKRLAGQLILLLLTTLILSQTVTLLFSLSETDNILKRIEDNGLLKKSAFATNTLMKIPMDIHKHIIGSMTTYRVQFHLEKASGYSDEQLSNSQKSRVTILRGFLQKPYDKVYVFKYPPPPNRIISVLKHFFNYLIFPANQSDVKPKRSVLFATSIMLEPDRWLNMKVYDQKPFPSFALLSLNSLIITSIIAALIVIITVKRITRPLKELTYKAKCLGVGEEVEPITEQGPQDIKDTIIAFNKMQLRLQNIITHRTRSLAAMSHDLRTPLTSMRLHAEFITDIETQTKIVQKIDEMEHITHATISFAKQDSWSEPKRQVDLAALIDSLCQDLSDIGLDVDCDLSNKINYSCRPIALRRAFSNLIENGVKYGHSVYVKIMPCNDIIEIIVSDQGPGIDESQQQCIFEPFERLDESRNYQSGGLGLGMTIALTSIRGHGGDIKLRNRKGRGLDVVVTLPQQ